MPEMMGSSPSWASQAALRVSRSGDGPRQVAEDELAAVPGRAPALRVVDAGRGRPAHHSVRTMRSYSFKHPELYPEDPESLTPSQDDNGIWGMDYER